MVCRPHLRNPRAVRDPASRVLASALRQKQFGSLVCTNDMQCSELLLRAPCLNLMCPAAVLVAGIPLHPFASSQLKNRKSCAHRMLFAPATIDIVFGEATTFE